MDTVGGSRSPVRADKIRRNSASSRQSRVERGAPRGSARGESKASLKAAMTSSRVNVRRLLWPLLHAGSCEPLAPPHVAQRFIFQNVLRLNSTGTRTRRNTPSKTEWRQLHRCNQRDSLKEPPLRRWIDPAPARSRRHCPGRCYRLHRAEYFSLWPLP